MINYVLFGKSLIAWQHARVWAYENPNKLGAIATPEGMFEIKFIPAYRVEEKEVVELDHEDDLGAGSRLGIIENL